MAAEGRHVVNGPDWTFIGLIGTASLGFGAALGLMLHAALPKRSDERRPATAVPSDPAEEVSP